MRTEDFRRFENEKHTIRGIKLMKIKNDKDRISEPRIVGKMRKSHPYDCGRSQCHLCGNPRRNKLMKSADKFTYQELKWRNVRRKDLQLREISLHLSIDNEENENEKE